MGHRLQTTIFIAIFVTYFHFSKGCQIEGANWPLPVTASILDTFRGTILDRSTTNIAGLNNVSFSGAENPGFGGPYVNVTFENSRLVIVTNDAFENYEENETSQLMSITVLFRCTGGSTSIFTFIITVEDTNNNAPKFIPSNDFVFTITAPVPPGFLITGCSSDLIVRDIDLTTQRIDFDIEENPYFEIEYNAASSNTPKEFKAILRTKTFIRTVREPIKLIITATDVDLTGDPAISTTASITIVGNTDFELPEEPVFSQTYYLAQYTDDNRVVLTEPITLQNGYHEVLQFSIAGEYSNNFELVRDGNQVTIRVVTPLEDDVLSRKNILLIVRANREFTNGASATVVVKLPEVVPLEFERAHYEGIIENNNLQVPQMVLSQGYQGVSISAVVLNEYSSNFVASVQGNTITLSMTSLDESVIKENSFIYLQIVASTGRSTASTIVTLEIIKDDNVTPVFNRPIYTGSYNPSAGLTLEQIVLVQGYDGIVSLALEGDYSDYFEVSRNGAIVMINPLIIPPEIFNRGRIVLSLEAKKPRTVGANAAVIISLPAARELEFEESSYRGSLYDNVLTIEPILLNVGYDDNIVFTITGDYASYFSLSSVQNQVIINLVTPFPSSIILENNVVILTLVASGLNAVTTTTSVLLDIIKDDTTTPVFSRNIYYGTYVSPSNINIDDINLAQGFEDGVTFRLDGDHAQYFEIINSGANNVVLSLRSLIPEDIIFNEKVLLFNVLAEKPLTVGANAAVSIKFPSELTDPVVMKFSQNTYTGTIDNNELSVDTIILSSGYATGTDFVLTGEYSAYFTLTHNNNVVSLAIRNPPPIDSIENRFIILDIEARRQTAVSVFTSVVIDILKQEVISPVFSQPYYRGVYNVDLGLQFNEVISLLSGYDETVTYQLEGDIAWYFILFQRDINSLGLMVVGQIPDEILQSNSHLLFSIVASKPGAIPARAAISIDIEKVFFLQFSQEYYTGTIEGGSLALNKLMSLESYTNDVAYALAGDYSDYFQLVNRNGVFTLRLLTDLPVEIVEANDILVLTLRAETKNIRTHTTIILKILKNRVKEKALSFENIYYVGSYSQDGEWKFDGDIRLSEEITAPVTFTLEGSQSQWFGLVQTGNTATLTLLSPIPSTVLQSNQQLVFAIRANSSEFQSATATIVITLTKGDFNEVILGFDRVTYSGNIENNVTNIGPITVTEGYTDSVTFSLYGELASYFTTTRQGSIVNVVIQTPIPPALIPTNRIIVLEIRASAPQALSAFATIVFEMIVEDDSPPAVQLAFDAPYYTGSYNKIDGLLMQTPIALSEGGDGSVQFALRGEHAQWFSVVAAQNSITLVVSSAIPDVVLTTNNQLVFVITAQRPGATTAQATIVISLTDEANTEGTNIGFDRVTYHGSINNNVVSIGPITVIEGYTDDITLGLYGDLASYFTTTRQGSIINVVIQTPIPPALIPTNRIIVLEIRASAPQALSAFATIVFEVIVEDDSPPAVQLAFDAPYYTGSYNKIDGLLMQSPIALSEGGDGSVQFALQGEHAQWFSVVAAQNSITLVVSSAIPDVVLTTNNQLVFVIAAQRPGATTAQATIVISLTDEANTEGTNIGFDRVTYHGSINNNVVSIGPITVIEGYTDDITLGLYGDLASYFTTTRQGSIINVVIQTPIPPTLIPTNRIIVLEIRASAPQALSAFATIVFEVIVEDDSPPAVQLAFDAPYYTGSYNKIDGLLMQTPIALSEGGDGSVQFALQGEYAQWFSVVAAQNSITLVVSSAIPDVVLTTNNQLVFVIAAQRPGATTAQATIVISLTDEANTEGTNIGFDRVTYHGSINNNVVSIGPITVIEGYTDDITLVLYGDLASYFTTTRQGSIINVVIQTPIPPALIPTNRIIVLEIRASAPQALSAFATIVFEVIVEDDSPPAVQLAFDAPYYTGSYNKIDGLLMQTPIALSEGGDGSVQFALQGEHAQWFSVVAAQNSITLVVSSAIPDVVLTTNNQLVFVITAQRPGATTAQATIVISLTDEANTEGTNIGFDRVTYLGSINNNVVSIGPITVIEGYTDDITLGLYGDLASYFTTTRQGSIINVVIQTPIPPALIPTNRIIVLEIRASAPQALSAFATIVFEVIVEDDSPPAVQLAFDAPYYTGSYNKIDGLLMQTPIALSEGGDGSVQFALQGEHAQWFSVVAAQNSITLVVSSAIPDVVLTTNNQLVFVIAAQRPGATTAQATIVISLTDEANTEGTNIGFDRVTYLGSINNNVVSIGPITVIEGYTDDITLGLYGDLASYFTTTRQGSIINVVIQTPIPPALIPTNRIIVLEIRASAPQALSAFATIVFEVIVEDDSPPAVQLAFDAPYYTGSYNKIDGLLMQTPIALSEGGDGSVQFALQGEHAQWFSVVAAQNSITLVVSSAIPDVVLTTNNQLVFVIAAQRPGATTAQATIVISLTDEANTEGTNIGFDRVTYHGSINNNVVSIGPITVIEGYTDDITLVLYGDLASYFTTTRQGSIINVVIQTPIPPALIPTNRIIVLEIRASAPQALSAFATIVFEVIVEDDSPPAVQLAFDAPYYTGSYNKIDGLLMQSPIALSEGGDGSVQFALQGEHAQWFSVVAAQNSITLVVSSAIPDVVLTTNNQLVFVITAQRPGATTAQATIVISLTDEANTEGTNIGFDRVTYLGSINNNVVSIGPITVIEGYTDDITLGLYGDLASYFTTTRQGSIINVVIQTPIPPALIPTNRIIVLEIRASAPQALSAFATIVFEVIVEDDSPPAVQLAFDAPYYTGSYNKIDGLLMQTPIALSEGGDGSVQFALQGEHAQWFSVVAAQNSITLVVSSAIPDVVLTTNNQLVFVIAAQRPGATTAQATIVISLTDEANTEGTNIGFDRVTYLGSINNNVVSIGPITVIEGYTDDITLGLYGDLASYFTTTRQGSIINVVIQTPIPPALIPTNRIIVLEIRASAPQALSAFATIVFEVIVEDDSPPAVQLAFDAPYYTGSYNKIDGLLMQTPIALSEGGDGSVQFALQGVHAQWFNVVATQNSITLVVSSAIPDIILTTNNQLVFVITAQRPGATTAQATIVISLANDLQTGNDVSFERVLYNGIIQVNEILHEDIILSGYDGTTVNIAGEYSTLFVASVVDGVVSIQASGSVTLPSDVTRLALELHAAGARAVLLLTILQSDVPVRPSVTFSSESYVLNVGVTQTGFVGSVSATADNGEAISYSLTIDNAHLQTRLSINNEGELHLSAHANSGVYTFQVNATTVITQATGTATIYLTVEAVTVCGDNNLVVPPLIILDRDEEEAHNNLVVLDSTQHAGCHFSLTNRWPTNQTWLYVDDNGLHATAIDREHASIAFMALSQIQIELILHCEGDTATRTKRSERTDWLGPYDYGTNKWILTDTIPYNSRRSLVNLIVNDINDNAPIFVGKEHEPIAVGYPTHELEERILPRSLVELKATDADIEENAAILYWSSDSVLAVAPTSGFVHVRSGARLQQDQLLTVSATDQRGHGLTGTIQLTVKLLDLNNIVVVTVRDAFLDDETTVLAHLSDSVGYEVRTLRSVVISDDIDEDVTRKKREIAAVTASLQLYVYGLIEREPVAVDRLVADINNNSAIVSVVSTVPLEDHLEDSQINIIERDIGLLIATIVLSVLLFIVILLIAIWFFLRWRKSRNYNEFTDENSLASSTESLGELPKPVGVKPRVNIEDLKKSERRLQDMLNAPIEEVTVETIPVRNNEIPVEAIVDLSDMSEPHAPIVFQSIDKLKDAEDTDDEFGENNVTRKKSVVTFNENVEKIIHVEEDDMDNSSNSGYEIYKF